MAASIAAAEAALQTAQNALCKATTFSEIQLQTHNLHTARIELTRAKQALGVAAMDALFPQTANPQIAAQSVSDAAHTALFGNKTSTTPSSWSAPPTGGGSCWNAANSGRSGTVERNRKPVSAASSIQTSEAARAVAEVKSWLKTVNSNHNFFTRNVRTLITTAPISHLLPNELFTELNKVVTNLKTIEHVKQIRDCDKSLSIQDDRAYMQARRNCAESGTRCLQIIEKNYTKRGSKVDL